MAAVKPSQNGSVEHWVLIRSEAPGQYTARVAGLPEIAATAPTRAEALERVRALLSELLTSGQLVALEVVPGNPLLQAFGCTDPNDPHERAYLEELARLRQEDLERTLRDANAPCSNSSSTPTT